MPSRLLARGVPGAEAEGVAAGVAWLAAAEAAILNTGVTDVDSSDSSGLMTWVIPGVTGVAAVSVEIGAEGGVGGVVEAGVGGFTGMETGAGAAATVATVGP